MLEKVVQGIDAGRITEAELQGRDLKEVRGQWQYYPGLSLEGGRRRGKTARVPAKGPGERIRTTWTC